MHFELSMCTQDICILHVDTNVLHYIVPTQYNDGHIKHLIFLFGCCVTEKENNSKVLYI